jgi:hypothetical protein
MKLKTLALTLALCFAGAATSLAQSAQMGTWKINEAKSKAPAGYMKNTTVVYTMDGDNIKVTTDGIDGSGKPFQTSWTGKFDGKDYPLTGDPVADSRMYTQVDSHTLALTNKKAGKVVTTGRIVVSHDGKSRTLNTAGTDTAGKKVTSLSIYDKQ